MVSVECSHKLPSGCQPMWNLHIEITSNYRGECDEKHQHTTHRDGCPGGCQENATSAERTSPHHGGRGMKLRTFTGLDKETECACGCNQKLLARPDVQVVVDMDSPQWKRDRYLPGHAGNSYGSSPYAQRAKKETLPPQAPAPTPPAPASPTPQGPSPASPQPQVDPAPVPTPKVVTDTAPSLADNRPWKILQVTISCGDYTSVKAGVADFGRENESLAQLGNRLVVELTNDIKTELDVVHHVQQGKPITTTKGAVSAPTTLSPAAMVGAPVGKGATVVGPELAEAGIPVRHVDRMAQQLPEYFGSTLWGHESRWSLYQVATQYLTREVQGGVNPQRERQLERAAARVLLLEGTREAVPA